MNVGVKNLRQCYAVKMLMRQLHAATFGIVTLVSLTLSIMAYSQHQQHSD
jgi:hypothetical protein